MLALVTFQYLGKPSLAELQDYRAFLFLQASSRPICDTIPLNAASHIAASHAFSFLKAYSTSLAVPSLSCVHSSAILPSCCCHKGNISPFAPSIIQGALKYGSMTYKIRRVLLLVHSAVRSVDALGRTNLRLWPVCFTE